MEWWITSFVHHVDLIISPFPHPCLCGHVGLLIYVQRLLKPNSKSISSDSPKKKKKGLYLVNVFIFYFQFLVFKKKRKRKLLCFQIVKQVWLVEKNFFFFEFHAPITSLCQHYCGSTLLRASLQFTRQKYRDQNNTKFNPEKGKMK